MASNQEASRPSRAKYDQWYAGEEHYWGKTPSGSCDKVLEIIRPTAEFRPKLLDLGCGEGRNAVYFAQHGFDVVGLDLSPVGLEKMKRYAEEVGVQIRAIQADITGYELCETYDVLFSTGTLQYLPTEIRPQRFENYRDHTSSSGINAFSAFVRKPFITKAPDPAGIEIPYTSGELMSYYWDWEIVYCTEEIFDCMSSGIPHKHAVDRIIARRYRSDH
jgi:tellurite methyltransferase